MCGILAALSTDQIWDKDQFKKARDTLYHRGPDDAGAEFLKDGFVALGHRRLSILDLSSSGRQPMQVDQLWIVFNGEIYNYKELRLILESKGFCFKSDCDTEVLLHGYKYWGKNLCDKLSGMFSFVIWNNQDSSLFCARDPIGQKPLYYANFNNSLILASEIKAIKALTGHNFRMRRESFHEFLVYDYIPGSSTWFEGIFELPPGHQMLVQSDNRNIISHKQRYWNFQPDPQPLKVSKAHASSVLAESISDSVSNHLQSDVEVGSLLSGGLDSNCVTFEASRILGSGLKTFCVGFNADTESETKEAANSSRILNCDHHEEIITNSNIEDALKRSLRLFDQPFGDPSQLPTWSIAKVASQKVKVVLTGDGGDEVFGGYWSYGQYSSFPPFDFSSIQRFLNSVRIRRLGLKTWQNLHENFTHFSTLNPEVLKILNPEYHIEDGYWYFRRYNITNLDIFRRSQWVDIKSYLPGSILEKVDRCTMAHSLEARPPLLERRLLERIFSLPVEITNPKGEYKSLLRKSYRKKIRSSILKAPKKGFAGPDKFWTDICKHEIAKEALETLIKLGFIAPNAEKLVKNNFRIIWRLMLVYLSITEGYFSGIR